MRALIFLAVGLTTISLAPTLAEAKTDHHSARHAAAAARCGGKERWDVKDGSDAGAGHVQPVIVDGITIAELNQLPTQPFDADGRMLEEKVIYRLTGVLRLFKRDADGDYHVVIADDSTRRYSVTHKKGRHMLHTRASGHSIVVEIPDPNCVSGADPHHDYGPSYFIQQLRESRSDFEAGTQHLPTNRELGPRHIPVTVTGVLFFDFMHGQTGHALPHPSQGAAHGRKVVELHPVCFATTLTDIESEQASLAANDRAPAARVRRVPPPSRLLPETERPRFLKVSDRLGEPDRMAGIQL